MVMGQFQNNHSRVCIYTYRKLNEDKQLSIGVVAHNRFRNQLGGFFLVLTPSERHIFLGIAAGGATVPSN